MVQIKQNREQVRTDKGVLLWREGEEWDEVSTHEEDRIEDIKAGDSWRSEQSVF